MSGRNGLSGRDRPRLTLPLPLWSRSGREQPNWTVRSCYSTRHGGPVSTQFGTAPFSLSSLPR
eukprot:566071-Rhodomonas_salina.1